MKQTMQIGPFTVVLSGLKKEVEYMRSCLEQLVKMIHAGAVMLPLKP